MPFASVTGEGVFVMSCGGPLGLLPERTLREQVAPALRQAAARLAGGAG
ncbi:transcriptional regulator [Bordetella pertussis]|nr:transcriptional regulator [Bordetella pertussis]